MDINVAKPWFAHIKSGKKTVEGRLNKGKFASIKVGQVLVIRQSDATKPVVAVVTEVTKYPTFKEYLCTEGLRHALPGINNVEDGVAVYRKFYSQADEETHGVLAIRILVSR